MQLASTERSAVALDHPSGFRSGEQRGCRATLHPLPPSLPRLAAALAIASALSIAAGTTASSPCSAAFDATASFAFLLMCVLQYSKTQEGS